MSTPEPNQVVCADCIEWLGQQTEPFADLIFADPPFNIGYKYDLYEDRRAYADYFRWTRRWMEACRAVLKPAGSFWIAIGDDYAAEVRIIGRRLRLHLRNWVIWYYTFGQNTKRKFARAHTHLFYFTNHPTQFTFNDRAVRTFSDRQREYNDKRANPLGKVPDDVWAEFPRVCGTFEEREGWHPCQMPEMLLERIVRVSSKVGDLVLDPFAGSGTTLVVAKRRSRQYVGIELSENYVQSCMERLRRTERMSDPDAERRRSWPAAHVEQLRATYMEQGVSTDRLWENQQLIQAFVSRFNLRLAECGVSGEYSVHDVWVKLERLRKRGKLGRLRVHAREDAAKPIRKLQRLLSNEG